MFAITQKIQTLITELASRWLERRGYFLCPPLFEGVVVGNCSAQVTRDGAVAIIGMPPWGTVAALNHSIVHLAEDLPSGELVALHYSAIIRPPCPRCDGKGKVHHGRETCPLCGGNGEKKSPRERIAELEQGND